MSLQEYRIRHMHSRPSRKQLHNGQRIVEVGSDEPPPSHSCIDQHQLPSPTRPPAVDQQLSPGSKSQLPSCSRPPKARRVRQMLSDECSQMKPSISSREREKRGLTVSAVCLHVSSSRKKHGTHVAGHYTRFQCDCRHEEHSYRQLVQHQHHAHGGKCLAATENDISPQP